MKERNASYIASVESHGTSWKKREKKKSWREVLNLTPETRVESDGDDEGVWGWS